MIHENWVVLDGNEFSHCFSKWSRFMNPWCKTVFWAICANKSSGWIPPYGHRPKARGQDSDGQSHSAASCSNVAPEKPIFSKAKKPAPFSEKKKQQLIFRQDSRVLGPICQKADSTKTIFLKICSFFPIFLTTFGTESRHSDRDILQVVLRSN